MHGAVAVTGFEDSHDDPIATASDVAQFNKTRDELVAKQNSNAEAYDRAILTLSSAFLGFSIAFVKDIVKDAFTWPWVLFASWMFFGLAIIMTIASIAYSQWAIDRLIDAARDFYLNGVKESNAVSKLLAKRTRIMNRTSGSLFVVGVFLTLAFAIENLSRSPSMPTETKVMPAPTETRGQPVNAFEAVVIPAVPTAPVAVAPAPSPAQAPAAPAADTSGAGEPKQ
jgi:hypothetical protein